MPQSGGAPREVQALVRRVYQQKEISAKMSKILGPCGSGGQIPLQSWCTPTSGCELHLEGVCVCMCVIRGVRSQAQEQQEQGEEDEEEITRPPCGEMGERPGCCCTCVSCCVLRCWAVLSSNLATLTHFLVTSHFWSAPLSLTKGTGCALGR